ncbi:hypothetical protein Tco_0085601 [Tanacetum coccineum]
MDNHQIFAEFNVGAACQTCLRAKVRLRSKHNFRERKKFERKCARQADLLKEKDIEIANLKAQFCGVARVSELNSLKERNLALEEEKNALDKKVVVLESAAAAKETELASLTAQTPKLTQDLSSLELSCDELSVKAASLDSQRDGFVDQDEQVKALSDRMVGLDSELMALALYLDEEFYPRFLPTIAGRQWIIGHGLRLAVMKCRQSSENAIRDLADVAAYDPSVEARYVSAVLAFRDLDFNLLSQLESHKDASIADITSLLRLEGPSAETPEVSWLQPSYEQLLIPFHQKEDNVVTGETSLSDSLDVVHAVFKRLRKMLCPTACLFLVTAAATTALAISVTAANISSIPPISVADYDTSDAGVQDTAPYSPKIVFKKEDLQTTPEHPSAS